MIRSMTGFGRGLSKTSRGQTTVELSSVNHRHFDLDLRLPPGFSALGPDLREAVQKRMSRGRVRLTVGFEPNYEDGTALQINESLAQTIYEKSRDMAQRLGMAGNITMGELLRIPGVTQTLMNLEECEGIHEDVGQTLQEALDRLDEMRIQEGSVLAADLAERLETIARRKETIAREAPRVVEEYRARLTEKISQLKADPDIREERIAMEVAVMADRCDITEELVRLGSHLDQFRALLEKGGVVGRKLDFLAQEIGREVNTVGSKARDAALGGLVVELKAELEKIREQVQNIE